MDAWRERDETRRRSLFLLEAQTKKVGGWVQAVAPRDGRLVSCRVVGISLLWPGVECQSAAANGKLEGVFLVAPVRWREREKKIGRLLKLEVVVFTTASTAAQQEQEQKEKRSHTMGSFSLFPRDLISSSWPACHPCSSRPMAPWTLVLRGPLSRACLPKLVCLSTQACFCSRDCGPELASLQSHTRDKPTRASFRMVGSAGVAGKARGWLAAVGSHPLPLFCRHRSVAHGGHLQQTCRPAGFYTGGPARLFQGPSNRSCRGVENKTRWAAWPLFHIWRPHGSDIRRWESDGDGWWLNSRLDLGTLLPGWVGSRTQTAETQPGIRVCAHMPMVQSCARHAPASFSGTRCVLTGSDWTPSSSPTRHYARVRDSSLPSQTSNKTQLGPTGANGNHG